MRYVDCPCGLHYDAETSPTSCPKCGKRTGGTPDADGKIRFSCPACGLRLAAGADRIGATIDCLACGRPATVPSCSSAPPSRPLTTTRRPAVPGGKPDGWRSTARWSLLAALIPLAIFTFLPSDDLRSRIEETKKEYPELVKSFERGTARDVQRVFDRIPSHRLVGAAFSRRTSAHWILAALSALIFWEFILIVQPMGRSTSRQLWAVGMFTGTIGVFLLLAIQEAAIQSTASGVGGCLLFPLKFIVYSYGAAMNPENGFLASMLGFTLGVGLMEEFFKALPLFWHFRKKATLDVRGAVVWGLATGIGFGVSEGMSYCKDFYNGISGGGMYVVRFSSCVALHAVWSATAAILVWRRRETFHALEHWMLGVPSMIRTLGISMVLHGFYDTCLKKNYGAAALASAVLSFALFFLLYDRACREEKALRPVAAA